jgi:predicted dehydrogenase
VRILVAGLGAIGQRHARNLRAVYGDALELLAYRRRRLPHVITETLQRDDTRDVERELGVTAFDDLDRALAADPDAVFVCTPSSQHLGIAARAAARGCHLFIEKPLSDSLDGVETLRQTVEQGKLVALVGCQWRFHPAVRWLRGALAHGALGTLSEAVLDYAEYLPDWHPYEDYRTSYAARADLGGGVVLTQIHDYDLAWWLFGAPARVTASGGHQSDLDVDVEDTVEARLDGGAVPVTIRQTFASRARRRTITVTGTKGTIAIDLLAPRVTSTLPIDPPESLDGYQRNQMFLDEVRHFAACAAGDAVPDVPLADGIAVLRLALAVKESLRRGCSVECCG